MLIFLERWAEELLNLLVAAPGYSSAQAFGIPYDLHQNNAEQYYNGYEDTVQNRAQRKSIYRLDWRNELA